jgi:hypothetical protein
MVCLFGCDKPDQAEKAEQPSSLGEWVSVAVEGSDEPVRLVFKSGGRVEMTSEGKAPQTLYFVREPAAVWWERRKREMSQDPKLKDVFEKAAPPFNMGPNHEVVRLGSAPDAIPDFGSWVMLFNPEEQVLSNPLTSLFVRPAAVAEWKEKLKEDAEARKPPEPVVIGSLRFEKEWSTILATESRFPLSIVAVPTAEGPVLALSRNGAVEILSKSGQIVRNLADIEGHLLSFQDAGGKTALAAFGTWGSELVARTLAGQLVWRFSENRAVDWACAVSLGPGKGDAIAISYNGGEGLSLIDQQGKLLWHRPLDGNSWFVGQLRIKNSASQILVIDNQKIRTFDIKGSQLSVTDSEPEAGVVMGGDLLGLGSDQVLTLGTTVASGQYVAVHKPSGGLSWKTKSPLSYLHLEPPLAVGEFVRGQRWIILGDMGGAFAVLSSSGKVLSVWQNPEKNALGFCTLRGSDGTDRLVIFSAKSVTSYRISSATM